MQDPETNIGITVTKEKVMTTITVIISQGWTLSSMVLQEAFLQNKRLNRDEATTGILADLGLEKASSDPAVFFYKEGGKLKGIMAIHGKGFLFGGHLEFTDKMRILKQKLCITTHLKQCFKLCGLDVTIKSGNEVEVRLADVKGKSIVKVSRVMGLRGRKLSQFEETMVRSRIQTLELFAATCRPDLCFILNDVLSEVNSSKKYSTVTSINTAVDQFHRHPDNVLKLVPLKGTIEIEVYCDSAFDGSNQIGYCLVMRERNSDRVNLIEWRITKSNKCAWSTMAAKTIAMRYGVEQAIKVKAFLNELGLPETPITVLTDDLYLKKALDTGRVAQEMRMRREMGRLRDLLAADHIDVRYIATDKMIASDLTKCEQSNSGKIRHICVENRLDDSKK